MSAKKDGVMVNGMALLCVAIGYTGYTVSYSLAVLRVRLVLWFRFVSILLYFSPSLSR